MKPKLKKDNSLFFYYGFTNKDEKKYPVISRILKELTPERIEKEIKIVQKVKLPPELQKWVKEYEKVGERDEFIWKLFLRAKQEIDYISTKKVYKNSLQEVKFLITIFVILLDDIADQKQNERLLNELSKIPFTENDIKFNKLNQEEKKYLNFTIKVWHRIDLLIQKYPEYKEFKGIFKYDIKQIVNAIEYDYLVSRNYYLINKTEYWLYSPHAMQLFTAIIVDLMCLSDFNMRGLQIIREITWQVQKMARIGNWVSTWEREIKEKDFTSGVFAYAINSKILTIQELIDTNNLQIIKKIKKAKIENKLLKEWENCYKKVFNLKRKIKTIDIQKLLNGLQKLLILEIINKRYK